MLFSSPTRGTYSQPLESRVQLHVNGIQRLQVLPVLYVSVEKKERLSCGTTRWSLCPGTAHSKSISCPPSPTPLPTFLSAKTFLQHVWGLDLLRLQHPHPQTHTARHPVAKTRGFSCCFLFCLPSALGKPNNMVLTTVSSAECATDPLNILAQVIASLCTLQRASVKPRRDRDSSAKGVNANITSQ